MGLKGTRRIVKIFVIVMAALLLVLAGMLLLVRYLSID
jgi:hypothetical protein